ncbi:hypothetical protein AB0D66_12695 [Streptomyces sp. NPDC048270]|uniref:hypothetical protein n=1 Tax=Streptomyces sp. NPDC048270 TaxID=3154615 RepID=UPI0033C0BE68
MVRQHPFEMVGDRPDRLRPKPARLRQQHGADLVFTQEPYPAEARVEPSPGEHHERLDRDR